LLVILPCDEMPVQTAIAIRQQIKSPFPLDLIARTPAQIQQRLDMGDFFIQDIFFMKQITQEWIDSLFKIALQFGKLSGSIFLYNLMI
jgi:uncharacterized protein